MLIFNHSVSWKKENWFSRNQQKKYQKRETHFMGHLYRNISIKHYIIIYAIANIKQNKAENNKYISNFRYILSSDKLNIDGLEHANALQKGNQIVVCLSLSLFLYEFHSIFIVFLFMTLRMCVCSILRIGDLKSNDKSRT